MSQTKQELFMVYFERPNGTIVLVKPRGEVIAFRHSISAERFVKALIMADIKAMDMTFSVSQETVMIDDRFPIRIIELADRTDHDLLEIAREVVASSLL